jgi:hypothetical protein
MDKKKFCHPPDTIRISGVISRTYKDEAAHLGWTAQKLMRKKIRSALAQFPDEITLPEDLDVHELIVVGVGKDAKKVRQICSAINVSVSDFLKVQLFSNQFKIQPGNAHQ